MWGDRFQGLSYSQRVKKLGGERGTESVFRILVCIVHNLSFRVTTRLDAGYTSRDLLNCRGLPAHSRRNDHRIPRLLLDNIAAILQNRHSRNRTSRRLRCGYGSRIVRPGNNTTLGHLHGWVCGVGSSRITWPFTIPGELDHGLTPGVGVAAPLNGGGREVDHDNEKDRN